ncbi:MAG: S8 family serine peptidase [Candidatus Thorarchaeota archaeon]|nr:S8 family serine peptidase [Candidatus Thorarchaeota archaeon]
MPLLVVPPVASMRFTPLPGLQVIDSMLAHEIENAHSSNGLASCTSIRAILQFTHELSGSQIELAESFGVRLLKRGFTPIHVGPVYLAEVSDEASLQTLTAIGLVRASPGSKQFYPSLSSSVPATKATEVRHKLTKDGSAIDGSGTLVAVLDTGVDWLHPSFWRVTTSPLNVIQSGGDYYVDLDNDSVPDSNEGPIVVVQQQNPSSIEVSNEYMYIDVKDNGNFDLTDGDRWLAGVDANDDGVITLSTEQVVVLGEPKVAIFYDQHSGNVYVRGVNLTSSALYVGDDHGHGTHVASIIAGGQPGYTDMVGVAPGADILAIRSPLMSADILDAIFFAAQNDADVINMSFSSFLGFLDGTDVEDVAISEAMRDYGLIASLASGNLAGSQKHASFEVQSGARVNASFTVSDPPDYSFLNILWYSYDDDEYVTLYSPNDESIEIGPFSEYTGKSFEVNADDLRAYVFADTSIKGTNRILVQVSQSDHFWTDGTWRVEVRNPAGETVDVNCFVWAGAWSDTHLRFTSHIDNLHTLSSPGTADLGITVGSCYDSLTSISGSSGRGPRIDGRIKPEVVAPGVGINAARNSLTSLWTVRSGTSMAAPHVAGVLALIRQASSVDSPWIAYSALVQGAGGLAGHKSIPLPDWGFGAVDALTSVRHVLSLNVSSGSTEDDWAGIPLAFGPSEDSSLNATLDIVTTRVYPTVSELDVEVTMRAAPDFSGGNTLTIEWDTDNNVATGHNGAEMKIEISGGTSTLYQWSGTAYVATSTTVGSHISGKSVLVHVGVGADLPCRLSISTFNSTDAAIDDTGWFSLTNTWRPLITDATINHAASTWTFDFTPSDIDTPITSLSYSWKVVDGDLKSLASDSGACTTHLTLSVDTAAIPTLDSPSLSLNISDDLSTLYAPLVILSGGLSVRVAVQDASLDAYTITTGPFLNGMITGEINVTGEMFIDSVSLALHSSVGYWLNFTLEGKDGVYPISVSANNIADGSYDAYAVVKDLGGGSIHYLMGTLHIVTDYSRVIIITAVVVGVIVIIKLYKMRTPP